MPVTAQHYVDSWLRILDPEKAFSYAFLLYDIAGAEAYNSGEGAKEDVAIKFIDDHTFSVTLASEAPWFEKKIGFAALFPVRLDVIEAGGELWATDPSLHVYNGPFVIDEWVKENSMHLVKNETYWDAENVHLTEVNMTIVDEFATQALLFESQQLDIVEGNQDYTKKWIEMANGGAFQYIQSDYPSVSYICFNQKNGGISGLMQNAKIRQALSLSINREELIDSLYERNYTGYGIIPYGMVVGDEEFRAIYPEKLRDVYAEYNGDTAKLQALFKEGMAECGINKELSEVTLRYITAGTSSFQKSLQEYWVQTWTKKLGINIEMQVFGDSKLFAADRNNNLYDIIGMGWNGDYNDPMTFLDLWVTESGYSKFMGWYSSAEYDRILGTLKGVSDAKERAKIYAELENQLVVTDAGIAPYLYGDSINFVQNYVKNFSVPMFGPKYEFSRAYISGK